VVALNLPREESFLIADMGLFADIVSTNRLTHKPVKTFFTVVIHYNIDMKSLSREQGTFQKTLPHTFDFSSISSL
jgi:uncharacterized protein YlaI